MSKDKMTRSERISASARESEHRIAQLPASTLKDGTYLAKADKIAKEVGRKYGLR